MQYVVSTQRQPAHLKGSAVGSPSGVGPQRRDALALVDHAREVGEAVLVALRLLLALRHAAQPSDCGKRLLLQAAT